MCVYVCVCVQGHQRAKEREAAVRRAALRAGRHPPRRTVRHQQRAGLRDARGRQQGRLRPRPEQKQQIRCQFHHTIFIQ